MGKLSLAAAAAVGYVFGTKAGRERYDQLMSQFNRVRNDPRVQQKTTEAENLVKSKAAEAASVAKDKAAEAAGAVKHKAPDAADDAVGTAKRAAGAEPGNNEGPDNRQPAPPQGI